MSRLASLPSLNLQTLKRPRILMSLVAMFVLLAVWWLGWMTPESSKLATVNQREQTLTTRLQTLQIQLQTDKAHSLVVKRDVKDLALFSHAVPASAEAGPLTTELYNLSKTTNVSITSLTDDSSIPPVKGAVIGSVPISIALKGTHAACLGFLADLYKLPRLITVNAVTPTPGVAGAAQAPTNVLASDNLPYTMTLTATAYFFAKPPAG